MDGMFTQVHMEKTIFPVKSQDDQGGARLMCSPLILGTFGNYWQQVLNHVGGSTLTGQVLDINGTPRVAHTSTPGPKSIWMALRENSYRNMHP